MSSFSMNADEKEWVKTALLEAESRGFTSKVSILDCQEAVPKGNNYVSDIFRLKVQLKTNGGLIEERSVIYKTLPVTENKLQGVKEMGLFKTEAKMYLETLRKMQKFITEEDPGEEPLWPEFYGIRGDYEGYLLEDLTVKGYIMKDRRKGLDYEHCAISLANLAKYNAISAVLIEKGVIKQKEFPGTDFYFRENGIHAQEALELLKFLVKAIHEKWPAEWQDYAVRLNKLITSRSFVDKILEVSADKEDLFQTLNHGDFWTTNILFKYDRSGSPQSLRFIDYQLPAIHTPCYDIHHLFSTSLRLEEKEKRGQLLRVYHSSLEEYLSLYKYSGRVPSLAELERDMERTRPFAFFIALVSKPLMMNPSVDELVRQNPVCSPEEAWGLTYMYDGEEYLTTIRDTLVEMKESGLL